MMDAGLRGRLSRACRGQQGRLLLVAALALWGLLITHIYRSSGDVYCGLRSGMVVTMTKAEIPTTLLVSDPKDTSYGSYRVSRVDNSSRSLWLASHNGQLQIVLPFESVGKVMFVEDDNVGEVR